MSVFDDFDSKVFCYRWATTLHLDTIAGGVPTDPKVAEGWLRTKLGMDKDDEIRDAVAKVLVERGVADDETVDVDAAVEEVSAMRHLNGFKRDTTGIYIEGRQVKAAIREAANIAWPKNRWGPSNKGTRSFFAEHVFVPETRVHIARDGSPLEAADSVVQRFVHTFRGSGIQYEEVCEDVEVEFTVVTDHKFDRDQWGTLWSYGQREGLGATRSQGYGTYQVTRWDAA